MIHCITNPISINQCANAILAVGGRPMMAEHPAEVAEITRTAGALVLNLGNITAVRMESMPIAARAANEAYIPVVLDAVGLAGSALRRQFVKDLLAICDVQLIKGNYSEIMTLVEEDYRATGVDAAGDLTETRMVEACREASAKYGCMILASGACDILAGSATAADTDPVATAGKPAPEPPAATPPVTFLLRNGTPKLAAVTGTGCMLGALCGAFLAASHSDSEFTSASAGSGATAGLGPIGAVLTACALMGIAGERAETDTTNKGTGSFAVALMDHISTLNPEDLSQSLRAETI